MSESNFYALPLLTGYEQFVAGKCSIPISVFEFWQWSASNLLSNVTRGLLAEFLVAKALGIDTGNRREEWASFDLETACGVKVEVKSASYLQCWAQKQFSSIVFGTKATRAWDYEIGRRSE